MEGGQVVIPPGQPSRHTPREARSSYPSGSEVVIPFVSKVVIPLVVPGRHTFGSHGSSYLWKPRFLSLWAWILLSTPFLRLQRMGGFELSRHGIPANRRQWKHGKWDREPEQEAFNLDKLQRRFKAQVRAGSMPGRACHLVWAAVRHQCLHTPWAPRSSYPLGGQVVIPFGRPGRHTLGV